MIAPDETLARAERVRTATAERTRGIDWDKVAPGDYKVDRGSRNAAPVMMGSKDLGFIIAEDNGLRVLHTATVAFFDVDLRPDERASAVLQKLHRFVAMNPEYGFRVYRTAAGLRYLCTTHFLDPAGEEAQALMPKLGVDTKYQSMCLVSQYFAARLNPKPKRVKGACKHAVTSYQFTTGSPLVLQECLCVLKLHDEQTGAFSDLPLA